MKKFKVTILLITDYYENDSSLPITKQVEYIVTANDDSEARVKAKQKDTSKLSVWESYAEPYKK